MGFKCCVFGCSSNYQSAKNVLEGSGASPAVPIFGLPKDPLLRSKWIKGIARENYIPTNSTKVCINHFDERFVTWGSKKSKGGDDSSTKKQRARLAADAVPTIFPNRPSYHTTALPRKRKEPNQREKTIKENEAAFAAMKVAQDKIATLEDIISGHTKFVSTNNNTITDWLFFKQDAEVLFLKIGDVENPRVSVSIKINHDLTVRVFKGAIEVNQRLVSKYMNYSSNCDSWTKFQFLLEAANEHKLENLTLTEKLQQLSFLIEKLNKSIENSTEKNEVHIKCKMKFIAEQVKLTLAGAPLYSSDTMLWARSIGSSFPKAYQMIRESGVMTLPHPSSLKTKQD